MDRIDGKDQRVLLSRLCSSYRDILKKAHRGDLSGGGET